MLHEPAWLVSRGRPSRNPVVESGSPYLTAPPLDSIAKDSPLRVAIEEAHSQHFGHRHAALPTLQPLVVHDTIVYRDTARIRALRVGSGDLLWEAIPEDALADLLARSAEEELSEKLPSAELTHRLWQNPACGQKRHPAKSHGPASRWQPASRWYGRRTGEQSGRL